MWEVESYMKVGGRAGKNEKINFLYLLGDTARRGQVYVAERFYFSPLSLLDFPPAYFLFHRGLEGEEEQVCTLFFKTT